MDAVTVRALIGDNDLANECASAVSMRAVGGQLLVRFEALAARCHGVMVCRTITDELPCFFIQELTLCLLLLQFFTKVVRGCNCSAAERLPKHRRVNAQ